MISKIDFYKMSDEQVVDFIYDNYDADDVNDVCEHYILNEICPNRNEFEKILEDWLPFHYIQKQLSGDQLKDCLWETVVCVCEVEQK